MNDIIYVDNKSDFINNYLPLIKNKVNGKIKVNGKKYYKIDGEDVSILLDDLENIRSLEFFIKNKSSVKYTKLVYMIMEFNK